MRVWAYDFSVSNGITRRLVCLLPWSSLASVPLSLSLPLCRPLTFSSPSFSSSHTYTLPFSFSLSPHESRFCVTSPPRRYSLALTWLTTCVTANRANTISDPHTSQSHNRPLALLSATSTCFIGPPSAAISPTVITLSVFQRQRSTRSAVIYERPQISRRIKIFKFATCFGSTSWLASWMNEWLASQLAGWLAEYEPPSVGLLPRPRTDTYSHGDPFHSRSCSIVSFPFTFAYESASSFCAYVWTLNTSDVPLLIGRSIK